jgi:predicted RNA binding protein YcfA (HicA-like mRNA interferase family)
VKNNTLRNRNYEDVMKILSKHFGFHPVRQKSSHIILEHPDGRHTTIPTHNPLKLGVIKSILAQTQIDEEAFLQY